MSEPAECARTEPAECVECEELGCPTVGMTQMCNETFCRYAMVCFGHSARHEAKHKAEREKESSCGSGCCADNDKDFCCVRESKVNKTPQITDDIDKWLWRAFNLLWVSIIVGIVLLIVLPD